MGNCKRCEKETVLYNRITPSVIVLPIQHVDSKYCDRCCIEMSDEGSV